MSEQYYNALQPIYYRYSIFLLANELLKFKNSLGLLILGQFSVVPNFFRNRTNLGGIFKK